MKKRSRKKKRRHVRFCSDALDLEKVKNQIREGDAEENTRIKILSLLNKDNYSYSDDDSDGQDEGEDFDMNKTMPMILPGSGSRKSRSIFYMMGKEMASSEQTDLASKGKSNERPQTFSRALLRQMKAQGLKTDTELESNEKDKRNEEKEKKKKKRSVEKTTKKGKKRDVTSEEKEMFLEKLTPNTRKRFLSESKDQRKSRTFAPKFKGYGALKMVGGEVVEGSPQSKSKSCMINIIKVFRQLNISEISTQHTPNGTFLRLYPVDSIAEKLAVRKMLTSKKFYKQKECLEIMGTLFMEGIVLETMKKNVKKLRSQREQDMEVKILAELLLIPSSSMFLLEKSYKFIYASRKKVRAYTERYKDLLIREPSLFTKILNVLSFDVWRNCLRQLEDFSLSLADTLYILRNCEEFTLRSLAISVLAKYPLSQQILLIKPLIQLLKREGMQMKKKRRKSKRVKMKKGGGDNKNNNKEEKKMHVVWEYLKELSQKSVVTWILINWELKLEGVLGSRTLERYRRDLVLGNRNQNFSLVLDNQMKLDKLVGEIQQKLSRSKEKRKKRILRLRSYLLDGNKWSFFARKNLYLPFFKQDGSCFMTNGLVPEEAIMWKSNKCPIRIVFKTPGEKNFAVLYKKGDDLRQDSLIISMISFCDTILLEHGLDLEILTYQIFPTSAVSGFVELVEDSFNLTEILERFENLEKYLRTFNRNNEDYENCIIIDFSFIFGKDPKLNPPPMRIVEEMIDLLGGITSRHFLTLTITLVKAYLILRKHSNEIITYLYCMIDAKILHVSRDNLAKTLSKFQLEKTDKEATIHILTVLFKSMTSIMPKINDFIHKVAQSLRD